MATPKRKLSVSLDEDLVEALDADGSPVSVQVNDAVRSEIGRRRRLQALARFCDEVVAQTGGWTEEDEVEIARIMRLLGG